MPITIIDPADIFIPQKPLFRRPYVVGTGMLGGTSPDGLITDNGAPTIAEIFVHLRDPGGQYDGYRVAATVSEADGTWEVTGLDTSKRYDVIARLAGENDVIMSDVTPV